MANIRAAKERKTSERDEKILELARQHRQKPGTKKQRSANNLADIISRSNSELGSRERIRKRLGELKAAGRYP
jgi:hypothetical protein